MELNKMRRILIVLIAVFATNSGWAQDAKAKEILDKVSEKTRAYNSIYADFTFSTENEEMDINESNDGAIKVKGKKYNLKMKGLKGSDQQNEIIIEVFSDGATLWNYMKDGNQVTVSDVEADGNELLDPSSIFTIYERGFKSEFVAEKNVGGKSVYQINLFPDSDDHDVTKIAVAIDKSTMMISSAILHSTDENIYRIVVKKLETDNDYPDTDFIFDTSKYNDVEVIDFR